MTDKDLTWLAIVQDRSGSIAECLADQEGGLNAFIDEQRKQPGRCVVTYIQFANTFETVFAARPIEKVGHITIKPRGGTALLDAIGHTIHLTGNALREMPESMRPGSVVVVINTDGEENASREFTNEQIARLVEQQTEQWQWLFVFLSATQDAISQARGLGMNLNTSLAYNPARAADTYAMAANTVSNYRTSTASGLDYYASVESAEFTDAQRDEAAKED